MGTPLSDRPNISDEVYDILFERILQREYQTGQRLKLRDLEKDLGVSRTPIITALQRLSENQLVTNVPRKGFFVTEPSPQDVLDRLEIRQELECYAARKAADVALEQEINQLNSIVTKLQLAMKNKVHSDYIDLDTQFHDLIISASHNHSLINIYRSLKIHSIITGVRFSFPNPIHERTHNEHERIAVAISSRNPDEAEKVMLQHISMVRQGFIELNKSKLENGNHN